MIGCYDYCGHYEWTFNWLENEGGIELLRAYWLGAVSKDSQKHARDLIIPGGFEGMHKYWAHTLEEEAAGYTFSSNPTTFRIDMHQCPSQGFLTRNNLKQYSDYCDHCMGWIGPMLADAGFLADHEHNHVGQCWWEIRKKEDLTPSSKPGTFAKKDVRLDPTWKQGTLDIFQRARNDAEKVKKSV